MDLYAITRASIETLAHEKNARGFIWIVVPEEGQAFGGLSWYGARGGCCPLQTFWDKSSTWNRLHPLVAALIVGVNKVNKYKIPRSQATAANVNAPL
ncbi:hypothetical protein KFL_008650020 [Klebsormidium nitens]|uniref:Uncharacterized protein n=1 Tax=Klebsormidium nitens TaxID=105231 RepID=A0A1Y1ILS0_KLENI|nr:hypothetical protein KFL_008650020 [Klebsormidium nitens]|eukprot:GAQ91835.1 hypothetical protein KFL_008650020 [Klebsormidium nitens]